jgi:hypothetical protein
MGKKRSVARTVLVAGLIASAMIVGAPGLGARAGDGVYGRNLIVNGDAEAGLGSFDGLTVEPVTGWITNGNFTVAQYGGEGLPSQTDPGPPDRGNNFFAGGPNNTSSSATQLINVAPAAHLIDSGAVSFSLSAYLGGFFDQDDNAVLSIIFERGGQVLGLAQIGPVLAADRGNLTGLVLRSTSGSVPAGTRQVRMMLQLTRAPYFFYNDGYADNLNLTLATLIGRNLIENGDAEAGQGSFDGLTVERVPGWATNGNFTVAQYGGEGLPSQTDPGPPDRGSNFFAGGPNNASSSASQLVNVAPVAHLIDSGAVTFNLSGYLGGFFDQDDNAALRVIFERGGQALGSAQIGPVSAADRGNLTGLLFRSTSGSVPAGTRQVRIVLQMTRAPYYFYNDGNADNLGLMLSVE